MGRHRIAALVPVVGRVSGGGPVLTGPGVPGVVTLAGVAVRAVAWVAVVWPVAAGGCG